MSNQDMGDPHYRHGDSITLPSDGTGEAGDAVTFDGEQVTPTANTDDEVVGVLADTPDGDENATVRLQGAVYARAGADVSPGQILRPDGADPGALSPAASGSATTIDTSTGDTIDVYTAHPRALEAASDGESVLVKLN